MRVMVVFLVLAVAGVGGLFWMVHGKPPALTRAEHALPDADAVRARLPDLSSVPLEPAQPEGSGLHKCIQGGKITYTDQPCPKGQAQRALDPERSRITTLPATRAPAAAPATPAAAPAAQIDIAEDGSVRRVVH